MKENWHAYIQCIVSKIAAVSLCYHPSFPSSPLSFFPISPFRLGPSVDRRDTQDVLPLPEQLSVVNACLLSFFPPSILPFI